MSAISKLAGQTGIYGVSSIVGRFLNYLLVPLYTAKLDPSAYGVVTEFYAYVAVLQVMLTYGMETGYFRFSQKNPDSNTVFSTVLTSLLSTSSLFILIIFIFSKSISNSIGYEDNNDYVNLFALILSIDAVSAIFFAQLRRLNKARKFMIFKLLNIGLNIFFNLFFILLCPFLQSKGFSFISFIYHSDYVVGYIFVSNLIASAVVLLLFLPDFFKIKFQFDFKLWKQILIYSFPLLITGLTGAVNDMADKILIKYWTVAPSDVADANDYIMYNVGIYGANAKLSVFMMLFVQAFRYAAEPFFFSFKKAEELLKVFADVMKYYIVFAFLMFLFIMLNIDIFKHFISRNYFEGLNVVFPLFLGRILVGVFFVLSFWYKLNDLTRYGIFIFLAGAVITIGLNYILIPKVGYIGAAWTNFFAYLLMVLISFVWSRKYMKVKYQYGRIFLYIIFALTLYFVSTQINLDSVLVSLFIKNIFLVLFIILVVKLEKIRLSDLKKLLIRKKSNES
ncbi:MAG: polysaccharide biosynthesis protein [Bacteroidales bacterium]|nr:polysaccharide biosynthesis protein [Bacteroidales bacterium]